MAISDKGEPREPIPSTELGFQDLPGVLRVPVHSQNPSGGANDNSRTLEEFLELDGELSSSERTGTQDAEQMPRGCSNLHKCNALSPKSEHS